MSLFAALRLPREVLFGVGQRWALGTVAKRYGTRVLICTDARLAADPVFAELRSLLTAAGLTVQVDATVQPEVPAASVLASAATAKPFAPEVIIGGGGGSCLDLTKCVALLLTHGGKPQDYYGEFKVPGPVLPDHRRPHHRGHRLRGHAGRRAVRLRPRPQGRHFQPAPDPPGGDLRSRAHPHVPARPLRRGRRRCAQPCHRGFHGHPPRA